LTAAISLPTTCTPRWCSRVTAENFVPAKLSVVFCEPIRGWKSAVAIVDFPVALSERGPESGPIALSRQNFIFAKSVQLSSPFRGPAWQIHHCNLSKCLLRASPWHSIHFHGWVGSMQKAMQRHAWQGHDIPKTTSS
jgi:hypothetical protein